MFLRRVGLCRRRLGAIRRLTMFTGVIFRAGQSYPEGFGIYSLVLAMVTFGGGFRAFGH